MSQVIYIVEEKYPKYSGYTPHLYQYIESSIIEHADFVEKKVDNILEYLGKLTELLYAKGIINSLDIHKLLNVETFRGEMFTIKREE